MWLVCCFMEIILKQDVANLGYKDEIVKVKNGYANNYLLPKGMAIIADMFIILLKNTISGNAYVK